MGATPLSGGPPFSLPVVEAGSGKCTEPHSGVVFTDMENVGTSDCSGSSPGATAVAGVSSDIQVEMDSVPHCQAKVAHLSESSNNEEKLFASSSSGEE